MKTVRSWVAPIFDDAAAGENNVWMSEKEGGKVAFILICVVRDRTYDTTTGPVHRYPRDALCIILTREEIYWFCQLTVK